MQVHHLAIKFRSIVQISRYADLCGADKAHLILFNRNHQKKWDEKIFRRKFGEHNEEQTPLLMLVVWGM